MVLSHGIAHHTSDRRGRLLNMNSVLVCRIGNLRYYSFRNRAATLFNCLTPNIRNINNCGSVTKLKGALNDHLCSNVDSLMMHNECNHLNTRAKDMCKLEMVQHRASRFVTRKYKRKTLVKVYIQSNNLDSL